MKDISKQIFNCFQRGNKLLIFGNGGSASMAQHFAGEFVCSFERPRRALPAIALTTDSSILTAWSNDFDFSGVFSRQVEAISQPGDILIGLSTSGKSVNVLKAFDKAKELNLEIIDFPRKGKTTAKIQEYQLKLMHDIVREVENKIIDI